MFSPLNLPQAKLKLSRSGKSVFVFCEIRRKKLVLTPEEWVRQHFVHFLLHHVDISKGKIISEMPLKFNDMSRRGDVVVIDNFGNPKMLIECKAPEIPINQKTFAQIAQYNSVFKVPLLVMTNGLQHVIIDFTSGQPVVEHDIRQLKSIYEKE